MWHVTLPTIAPNSLKPSLRHLGINQHNKLRRIGGGTLNDSFLTSMLECKEMFSRCSLRVYRTVNVLSAIVLSLIAGSLPTQAAEVPSRDLLPNQPLVLIEIERPLRMLDHPLAEQLWSTLRESKELQRHYDSPEYDRLRALVELAQAEFGVGWRESLERVTQGGILLAVEQGTPPKSTLILTADKPETIVQFGKFAKRLGEGQSEPQKTETKSHRDFTYYKGGDGFYTVAGRRLVVTSSNELMHQVIDRLLDAAPKQEAGDEADAKPIGDSVARITVNMQAIREMPGVEGTLKVPTTNIAQFFLTGDSLDLLRRSDRITIDVAPAVETLDIAVRFSADKSSVTPGLAGFFALEPKQQAAPLLQVPDTLYTSSWFRDYEAIWEGRSKVLVETSLKAVDEGNQTTQNRLALVGAGFLPSEMLKSLGTQFRFVVARQSKSLYENVELDGRFPAAALALDLRDEEYFTTKVIPALRAGYGLATASQNPRVLAKQFMHKEAKLTSLVFDDSKSAAAVGNKARFNASPTFTVTRNHFIIGSTREIVEQVIDALEKEQDSKPDTLTPATSRQLTLLPGAADLTKEFQPQLVRTIVFNQGLSIGEAEHELDILRRIVSGFGHVAVSSGFGEAGYEYRITVGPEIKK